MEETSSEMGMNFRDSLDVISQKRDQKMRHFGLILRQGLVTELHMPNNGVIVTMMAGIVQPPIHAENRFSL